MRWLTIACATAMLAAGPVQAQPTQPGQVEQALGIDFRNVLCTLGGMAVEVLLPGAAGELAREGAERVGLCPRGTTAGSGNAAVFPAIGGAAQIKPGLQFKILKVAGQGDAMTLSPTTPDTRYAQDEGIVLFMAHNAPGYLQIWSIDDTSERLLEGVMLSGSTASVITLPDRARGGFYRFTTAGGTDKIRLRFLPCRHGSNQALEFTASNFVASQVAAQIPANVETMIQELPSCPFTNTFAIGDPNDALFRRPQVQQSSYLAGDATYSSVLTRGGADNATSLVVDIELKRQ